MAYDENSIRILSASEVRERFSWLQAEMLARDNHLPVEWVKRGFEASRRLGIEPDYFIARYIRKEDIPRNADFEAVFIEILREGRNVRQKQP
ncbi:hypothetical protein EJD04_26905 [Salmonella enterica]|nr:hypothetical protein [Salmonella enterica]